MAQSLQALFEMFCAFGSNRAVSAAEMDSFKFVKFCRDTKLLDKNFTPADADLIHSKAKGSAERRISYPTFRDVALPLVAAKKGMSVKDLIAFVKETEGPNSSGTKAESVKLHDERPVVRNSISSRFFDQHQQLPRSQTEIEVCTGRRKPRGHRTKKKGRRSRSLGANSSGVLSDPEEVVEPPAPPAPALPMRRTVIVPSMEMAHRLNCMKDGGNGYYDGLPIEVKGQGLYNDLLARQQNYVNQEPIMSFQFPSSSPSSSPVSEVLHSIEGKLALNSNPKSSPMAANGLQANEVHPPNASLVSFSTWSTPNHSPLAHQRPRSPQGRRESGPSPQTQPRTPDVVQPTAIRPASAQAFLALFQAQCSQLCACLLAAQADVPWDAIWWSRSQVQAYFRTITGAEMTEKEWLDWVSLLPPALRPPKEEKR